MYKGLIKTAQEQDDIELFHLVRENYAKVNSEYIEEQIKIASKYLTPEQKKELKEKGLLA